MPVTVTPLGVRCNLQCGYCYEDPQRNAGNFGAPYDLEAIKSAIVRESRPDEPFLLFGGEPLLLPKPVLEDLWAWGFARSGRNSLQTNGSLIDRDHIALFMKYKVGVGISIDGPGPLNDARWNVNLDKTRASTRKTEEAIALLCESGSPPSLIVTLHRLNASSDHLETLANWFRSLTSRGIRRIGVHLLEVEDESMRERFLLSDDESTTVLTLLRELRAELPQVAFSLLNDLEDLMRGNDSGARCIWQACDPYVTPAVKGIDGQGERTKCSRVNKEGIDFLPSASKGFERYTALYLTPQDAGGCQDCRFFLTCRSQCPGTAIDGDWRNRSEQCHTWKRTFETIEQQMLAANEVPISLSPDRRKIEEKLIETWRRGRTVTVQWAKEAVENDRRSSLAFPSLERIDKVTSPPRVAASRLFEDELPFQLDAFSRIAWTSARAQTIWQPVFTAAAAAVTKADVSAVSEGARRVALLQVSASELEAYTSLWASQNLAWQQIASTTPVHSSLLYAVGISLPGTHEYFAVARPSDVQPFAIAWQQSDSFALAEMLGYPACCADSLHRLAEVMGYHDGTWVLADSHSSETRLAKVAGPQATNVLVSRLGVRLVAHRPCSFHCQETFMLSQETKARIFHTDPDAASILASIDLILDWPSEWSALHGIAELRTPVAKLCSATDATAGKYAIQWKGKSLPAEAARGVVFPYQRGAVHEELVILR